VNTSHAVSLEFKEAWGDDAAAHVDSVDVFGTEVVVGRDETRFWGEVEVLREEFAVYAEQAVGEAY
jgi:hypothetical protein